MNLKVNKNRCLGGRSRRRGRRGERIVNRITVGGRETNRNEAVKSKKKKKKKKKWEKEGGVKMSTEGKRNLKRKK